MIRGSDRFAVCVAGLSLLAGVPANASIALSLDILSAGDPGAPAPPGLVVVDAFVDVSDDDYFYAGYITAHTLNGATFVYHNDPDQGAPVFLPPGPDHRYVTFGSAAYGRNAPERFHPAGTLEEQSIFLGPAYDPPYPVPDFRPNVLNTVYIASPLPPNLNDPRVPRGRDGYVLRIALDITQVGLPGGGDAGNYRIYPIGSQPPGFQPVLLSFGPTGELGVLAESIRQPNLAGENWGLYVPEPVALNSAVVFGLLAMRKRG